jgi:hypothetical protein
MLFRMLHPPCRKSADRLTPSMLSNPAKAPMDVDPVRPAISLYLRKDKPLRLYPRTHHVFSNATRGGTHPSSNNLNAVDIPLDPEAQFVYDIWKPGDNKIRSVPPSYIEAWSVSLLTIITFPFLLDGTQERTHFENIPVSLYIVYPVHVDLTSSSQCKRSSRRSLLNNKVRDNHIRRRRVILIAARDVVSILTRYWSSLRKSSPLVRTSTHSLLNDIAYQTVLAIPILLNPHRWNYRKCLT